MAGLSRCRSSSPRIIPDPDMPSKPPVLIQVSLVFTSSTSSSLDSENSLAVSSLITGDGGPDSAAKYGNGYHQENGDSHSPDQHNIANYTSGSVGDPYHCCNAGEHPSETMEEQQQLMHRSSKASRASRAIMSWISKQECYLSAVATTYRRQSD